MLLLAVGGLGLASVSPGSAAGAPVVPPNQLPKPKLPGCQDARFVSGPIRQKWLELGGQGGPLGCPRRPVATDHGGSSVDFDHGGIVTDPSLGPAFIEMLYQARTDMIFEWSGTGTGYSFFNVRWDRLTAGGDWVNENQVQVDKNILTADTLAGFGGFVGALCATCAQVIGAPNPSYSRTGGKWRVHLPENPDPPDKYKIEVQGCEPPDPPGRPRSSCTGFSSSPTLAYTPFSIDFTGVGPARTPKQALAQFASRAKVITNFEACWRTIGTPVFFDDKTEFFDDEDDFMRVALAKLERYDRGWGARCPGQALDNLQQVNRGLALSQRRSNPGTSSDSAPCKRKGEYDVALRGLITIIYRFGGGLSTRSGLLTPKVRGHVLDLLSLRGPVSKKLHTFTCGITVSETENHIWQEESSRYLTNQLLFADAERHHRPTGRVDNNKNGVTTYILERLRNVLRDDFSEFNSRPYANYSVPAIQNLYEFADKTRPGGAQVSVAAHMVLDYLAAKFAVSSNGLRRAVPFRRRLEHLDQSFLMDGRSDIETNRFVALSGLTQFLPGGHAHGFIAGGMQTAVSGSYRVPSMILDLMMTDEHKQYFQRIHHYAAEAYSSTPDFLISAGGLWRHSPEGQFLDDFVTHSADTALALPTTLMPSRPSPDVGAGLDWRQFIRIEGNRDFTVRRNTCVAPGFACGLNPVVPPRWLECSVGEYGQSLAGTDWGHDNGWAFVDGSGHCPAVGKLGFYVAVYQDIVDVPNNHNNLGAAANSIGFFEAVPDGSSDSSTKFRRPTFADFRAAVLQRNPGLACTPLACDHLSAERTNTYVTSGNRRIQFVPYPPGGTWAWGVQATGSRAFDSQPHADIRQWPLAEGDIMNSNTPGHRGGADGHRGYVEICNPWMQEKLILDMRDFRHPRRTLVTSLLGSVKNAPSQRRGRASAVTTKALCSKPAPLRISPVSVPINDSPPPPTGPPPQVRQLTSITVTCPGSVTPGESTTLGGHLTTAPPEAPVTITVAAPSGAKQVVNSQTNSTGDYSATITPNETGQWGVTARYPGDANYLDSSTQCGFTVHTSQPGKAASTTSIVCPTSAQQYQTFRLTGTVGPPHPQSSVQVTWTSPGGAPIVHQVSTNDQSNYADLLSTGESGAWHVQTYWPGDTDHQDSYSQICQFNVYFIPR